jgi:regulator of protease activity HflC (stomatin/prohibitin superfamily)
MIALGIIIITGFVIVIATVLAKSVYLVRQAEAIVIERFGRYDRTLMPGLHIIVPFIETPRETAWTFIKEVEGKRFYRFSKVTDRIDQRETMYDFPRQNVITKDNVTMEISALLYYQITDAKAAIYEVSNLPEAIEKLTQTTLRNVIGSMDLDETLVSRDQINTRLRVILDDATDKWGVKINRVELQEVTPPEDIRQAMEKQMRAERDRRAIILEAEGAKQATILTAEGQRESAVLSARGAAESRVINAEGEAEARLRTAQGEAQALELIKKALPESDPTTYLIALQYMKVLPTMMEGKDNKLIVVPYEASTMMASLAGVKRLFEEQSR